MPRMSGRWGTKTRSEKRGLRDFVHRGKRKTTSRRYLTLGDVLLGAASGVVRTALLPSRSFPADSCGMGDRAGSLIVKFAILMSGMARVCVRTIHGPYRSISNVRMPQQPRRKARMYRHIG